jgi:hypothetical protein
MAFRLAQSVLRSEHPDLVGRSVDNVAELVLPAATKAVTPFALYMADNADWLILVTAAAVSSHTHRALSVSVEKK